VNKRPVGEKLWDGSAYSSARKRSVPVFFGSYDRALVKLVKWKLYLLFNRIYIRYIYIYIYIYMYMYIYVYRMSLKMDRSHIGGGEWIKGSKKFLYYFEILAVVFELEKETSKPICG